LELIYADYLRRALVEKHLVVMAGRCTVEYDGRAASHLGEGERVVIIKGDGSVLVHRPQGYEPVNWHPPGSKIQIEEKEEGLLIRATRTDERLIILFSSLKMLQSIDLRDEADFQMYASEADMKKAVLLEPSLIDDGFRPYEQERPAFGAGFIDVLGVDREGRMVVVEIKRREATGQDVEQLLRYVSSLERELGKRPRAIIAAPSLSRQAATKANQSGVEFRCVTPRRCREIIRRRSGLHAFHEG